MDGKILYRIYQEYGEYALVAHISVLLYTRDTLVKVNYHFKKKKKKKKKIFSRNNLIKILSSVTNNKLKGK